MNNENPNVENVQEAVTPAVPVETESTAPVLNTVDPTASFETVDPTAVAEPAVTETPSTEPKVEVAETKPAEELVTEPSTVPSTVPVRPTASNLAPLANATTRYNPVTGEEVNVNELLGKPEEPKAEEVVVDEKLKTVEVNYKPNSKGRMILLFLFFVALILFVIFLPDIQTMIALYKSGPEKIEEITTGRLVCTLESNTVNLDRTIERVFEFTDNKVKSAKFTTVVRGDASLDEEALDELNKQCTAIKESVAKLDGINVSCEYEEGLLTEKEDFDYETYHIDEVSAAYTEAGGTMLEFEKDEDIDIIMKNMRQGGFTCNKEK